MDLIPPSYLWLVKVCPLAAYSPPGSVCLQWHWLMFFVMARIKWTVHLHLILCTQDAVNNSIQVTSTWDAVSLKKKKMDMRSSQDLNLGLLNSSQMFLLTEQQEFWH